MEQHDIPGVAFDPEEVETRAIHDLIDFPAGMCWRLAAATGG